MGIGCQGARQNADGIVATVAVTSELDSLGARKNVHAGSVEGCSEGVRMKGLPPHGVRLRMAVLAIFGARVSAWLNESSGFCERIAGCRHLPWAEPVAVAVGVGG